jgi:hypothetical protein
VIESTEEEEVRVGVQERCRDDNVRARHTRGMDLLHRTAETRRRTKESRTTSQLASDREKVGKLKLPCCRSSLAMKDEKAELHLGEVAIEILV